MPKRHLHLFVVLATLCTAGFAWWGVESIGKTESLPAAALVVPGPAYEGEARMSAAFQNATQLAGESPDSRAGDEPASTPRDQYPSAPAAESRTTVSRLINPPWSALHPAVVAAPKRLSPPGDVRKTTTSVADGHFLPPAEREPEPSAAVMNRAPAGRPPSDRVPAGRLVSSANLVLALDAGVKTPVALLEDNEGSRLSVQQAGAKNQIADDFSREVSEAATERHVGAADIEDVWLDAQARADERYRLLFGDANYQQQIVRAAQEALAGQ